MLVLASQIIVAHYNLDHQRNIYSFSKFYKVSFSSQHPLSYIMPETLIAFRSTQRTHQMHSFSIVESCCNTSQFQWSFIPSTSELWNGLHPGVFILYNISKFIPACTHNQALKSEYSIIYRSLYPLFNCSFFYIY